MLATPVNELSFDPSQFRRRTYRRSCFRHRASLLPMNERSLRCSARPKLVTTSEQTDRRGNFKRYRSREHFFNAFTIIETIAIPPDGSDPNETKSL